MKMRRDHFVPLADQALKLLDELRPFTGESGYLFASLRSWYRPMCENTMNAALRRMGYSGDEMTAHGFRVGFSHKLLGNCLPPSAFPYFGLKLGFEETQ